MRLRSYFAVVLPAACFAACSDPVSAPQGSTGMMPLAVGNRWFGEFFNHNDSTGTDEQLWLDTMTVTGTMQIGGETWYVVTHRGANLAFTDTAQVDLMVNRPDGLYSRSVRTDTNVIGSPNRLIAYPGAIGDSAQTERLGSMAVGDAIGIMYDKLTSKSDAVDVPAGTFRAYRVETIFAYDSTGRVPVASGNIDWYVPGIGLVKTLQRVIFSHIYSGDGFLNVPSSVASSGWLGYRLLSYHLQ